MRGEPAEACQGREAGFDQRAAALEVEIRHACGAADLYHARLIGARFAVIKGQIREHGEGTQVAQASRSNRTAAAQARLASRGERAMHASASSSTARHDKSEARQRGVAAQVREARARAAGAGPAAQVLQARQARELREACVADRRVREVAAHCSEAREKRAAVVIGGQYSTRLSSQRGG